MPWLIAGLLLAALLLLLLNWWARADVKTARASLFWAIIAVCAVIGGLLLAAGKGFMAVLPAGFALWRMFGANRTQSGEEQAPRPRRQSGMSKKEALDVLGLKAGATEDDIKAAYKRMIAQAHPDKGGSDWVAAKLNEARKVLLNS